MDQGQYTTLMEALAAVPDPRKLRGRRYPWAFLLALISSALASGHQHGRAIAQWVHEHAEELRLLLHPPRDRFPSESTLRRVLRTIDLAALETRLAQFTQQLEPESRPEHPPHQRSPRWRGQALDGKEVRGARAHGSVVHLVSLVRHGTGLVLGQVRVATKSNEITAVPQLLAGRELRGTVTTMDALLTQRRILQQILDQHGHYLAVVKLNQPDLYAAIALLFERPPWLVHERAQAYQVYQTCEKGHGRLETRTLESSPSLNAYLDWPGVGQVLRRHCHRVILKTGEVSDEVSYGITSLQPSDADVTILERMWRAHWTIENRVHYVRDVTMGEDASQVHTGNAPQALAALRNGILSLIRVQGWTNVADALRHYGACVSRALDLVGAAPARL